MIMETIFDLVQEKNKPQKDTPEPQRGHMILPIITITTITTTATTITSITVFFFLFFLLFDLYNF